MALVACMVLSHLSPAPASRFKKKDNEASAEKTEKQEPVTVQRSARTTHHSVGDEWQSDGTGTA
jgi:hypothetical protein